MRRESTTGSRRVQSDAARARIRRSRRYAAGTRFLERDRRACGSLGGRGEAHRRAADGGRDPGLAARAPRRGLPGGRRRASGPGVVLDVGCGVGDGDRAPRRARPARVGVDYSSDTVRAGRDARRGSRRRCEFVASDGAALGLRDRSVDYVVSSHIIEHFVNPALHVIELARVLRARRHRVRDHAERAGRLREPVPRVPVRARAPRVVALALLRRRHAATASRATRC